MLVVRNAIEKQKEKLIPCHSGLDLLGIGLDLWIIIMIMSFVLRNLRNIGEQLICMLDEQSMQFYIYFMEDFGIKYFMISSW